MGLMLFALATLSPILYAATNHLDNILLQKYFKKGGVGTLILFSALLSVFAIPVFYLVDPSVMTISWSNIALLSFVGFLNVLLLWCYLQAIFNDEPLVVIIYYQLVPVLGLFFGYIALGEVITSVQLFAMLLVILGAIVLSVAMDDNGKVIFRVRTAVYMLIASICWALESTLFKVVALKENVWHSLFWEHVALVVIGILLLVLAKGYRKNFLEALKFNSVPVLSMNFLNESLYIVGNSVAAFVVVLIPVSLTLLMNSFQPLFVLIIGLLLQWALPKLAVEHVSARQWPQKAFAIVLTAIGVYLIGDW
jgi:drug/metabolite transporter (DMT)-like permease